MTAIPAATAPVNPALAQLKDIHLPEQIGAWPPAPGYLILLGVLFLAAIAAIWLYRRRAAKQAASRQASALLQALDPHSVDYARQVNTLLKRTALSYLPRTQIAALDGERWLTLLASSLTTEERQNLQSLLTSRFSQKALSAEDADRLTVIAQKVIKSLPYIQSAKAVSGEAQVC